ncbi:archaeal heat shock protein Hsp20 [Sulfuracidifex metallicus]|uniref:Hsp20 family protein n=1 Tax=Sulfuracidifex metallicus DSM 6482 = JCM 9184 TaxID=523847 RepID=A0A6A9QPV8_SULME|nr:archaeal heat shock protein Hsp20 [Sulfuracidifex metallicus]MUN29211.1 Hsp20 family protein [Sulfuracidifex metallicus DSM 6482 = JCM 9184]WOE50271.1 Hsp20/alpha crystallin family protein [Sulfuracidifex metallicus DSM 6482 = JCM 9184]
MPVKRRSIFDIMDEIMAEMDEEFRRLEREFMRGISKESGDNGPYIYGVKISVGPDGTPKIEEFGNVKKMQGKPIVSDQIEPLVDVLEKGDDIKVVAEVPGISKDDVKLKIVGQKLVLFTSDSAPKKYYAEVELPSEVDENSAKASYKNGIVEITLKKKNPKAMEGKEIKIE